MITTAAVVPLGTVAAVVPLAPVPSLEEVFKDFLFEVSKCVSLVEVNVAAGVASQALLGIVT